MSAPLLDMFFHLIDRRFSLGVAEYQLLLEALGKGQVGSRAELIFLCQLLWGKSIEAQEEIARVIEATLPKQVSLAALERLAERDTTGVTAAPGTPKDAATVPSSSGEAAQPPAEPRPPRPSPPRPGSAHRASSRSIPAQGLGPGVTFRLGSGEGEIPVAVPEARPWRPNPSLDFNGEPPVARRHLARAWRSCHRPLRVGPALEPDLSETVRRLYRTGVYTGQVLVPRRVNQARLLVLIDSGGSMVPFRREVQNLLESLEDGRLLEAGVLYVHDVVGELLFTDARLTEPARADMSAAHDGLPQARAATLEEALAPWAGASVLIVSDGGAARGRLDRDRLELTGRFLDAVRRFASRVVWLNPTPADRWPGTTAGLIRRRLGVPMFAYDRAGIDAAARALKGVR